MPSKKKSYQERLDETKLVIEEFLADRSAKGEVEVDYSEVRGVVRCSSDKSAGLVGPALRDLSRETDLIDSLLERGSTGTVYLIPYSRRTESGQT